MAVNEYNIQRNRVKGALKMQNTVTDKNTERLAASEQPGTESYWVFLLLMFVGGFYGAFTYSIRGGVFCNAQTSNFVLMAMAFGNGETAHAFYYLIPITAYFLGAVVSEFFLQRTQKIGLLRWETVIIVVELGVVVFLGLLPESAPFQITQITLNFLCSMRYNTFRKTRGIAMATTFCTNHLRQTGIAAVGFIKDPKDREKAIKLISHVVMIVTFVVGAVISTALCRVMMGKAIFVTLIPLTAVFVGLVRRDIKSRAYTKVKTA